MKKLPLLMITFAFILAFSIGAALVYSGSDPAEEAGAVAVEWFEAQLQTHEAKKYSLLVPRLQEKYKTGNVVEKDRPAENPNFYLEDYELTSWEYSEDVFIFRIRYFSPKFDGREDTEWVKVERSGEEWRVSNLVFDENNAKPFIEGKKSKRLEELGA